MSKTRQERRPFMVDGERYEGLNRLCDMLDDAGVPWSYCSNTLTYGKVYVTFQTGKCWIDATEEEDGKVFLHGIVCEPELIRGELERNPWRHTEWDSLSLLDEVFNLIDNGKNADAIRIMAELRLRDLTNNEMRLWRLAKDRLGVMGAIL